MLSRTSEHKQTARYANNLIMRLLFYPRSCRCCLIQRDRNTCSNLVLPWSIYSRKNWFFFAGCNHSVINHYKRKRVQSICAGIPLFTLPGTNHFTYRLIESSFDPKSAPNSNRNRLPRNWPSSPIRATTCWSCSKLSNTVPQLNSNKQELLIQLYPGIRRERKIYLEILETWMETRCYVSFPLSLSLSLPLHAHVTILERFAWLLETRTGFETPYTMRATVSYPSSNRGLPFEAKRYEKGERFIKLSTRHDFDVQ